MPKRRFMVLIFSLLITVLLIGGCDFMEPTPKMPETKTKFPESSITLTVPFSPGGGADLQARALETMFAKHLKKSLIVVNKPGGGGTLAWNELVKANPDGYTIGITTSEIIMQALYGESKFHYPTALDPLAQITSTPFILYVNIDQPWNTLEELLQYAKENPSIIKFGNAGIGTTDHLLAVTLSDNTKISCEHVPFKGSSEALAALLGNHIQVSIASPAALKEQLNAGRIKALAMTGEKRFSDPELAQIPTFKELGYDEMTLVQWFGIAAPQMLPPLVKEKLVVSLKEMVADPEFKSKIVKMGINVDYKDSEESKKQWVKDLNKYIKMIKETGIGDQIKDLKK